MSTPPMVERDERTTAVENVSYCWALNFVIFALLIDVTVRAFVYDEGAMDLIAIILVSSIVSFVYQARHKALPNYWANKKKAVSLFILLCTVAVLAAVIAAVLAVYNAGAS